MGDNNMDNHDLPSPSSLFAEPKGYGLSGKIMLSAIVILFGIVIIMVCLHVYARWYIIRSRRRQVHHARRRTHLVFYVEPDNPGHIIPVSSTPGLDAAVIKSLPTFTYNEGDEVGECAVCLSEFEGGEKGRVLPACKHSFHVDCIDMWFHSHSTCPICRATVVHAELTELTRCGTSLVLESEGLAGPRLPELPETSSSFGGRRKGLDFVGVSIEVPRRSNSFSFTSFDESGPSRSPSEFKSPTSRILSLKRILSREKKSPLHSPSGTSCSAAELDVELGRVEGTSQPSQVLTPR